MKMTKQKLTKKQRKKLALEKYEKVIAPALNEHEKAQALSWKKFEKVAVPAYEEYEKECEKIDSEPDEIPEIIEHNGRKYKLIEGEK